MCGIAGILTNKQFLSKDQATSLIESMTFALKHRGPDHGGIWIDPEGTISFGHRRLSIIDLSPAGNQPMHSSCQRYCIVYNGEVYNSAELKEELKSLGKKFKGHSDTEVIIEACSIWGVRETVNRLIGMFAFALWDKEKKILYLIRDRLGIKPLYWGRFGGLFLFSSELKSLRKHPGWRVEINRNSLACYVRHNYIPAPYTIYKGIHKLEPGCILEIGQNKDPKISQYWKLEDIVAKGLSNRKDFSDDESILLTEKVIESAVTARLISDVPLGAFLSGGIDSSVVVALMQKSSSKPIKSFSIGFHEKDYDEATYARDVAGHLGTEHTEFYVRPEDALEVIPGIPNFYDEPFADSSQIPTYLVSKLTRQHVTVALSGDGGDEVFAGYNRYFFAENLEKRLNYLPHSCKKLLRSLIYICPPTYWDRIFSLLPGKLRQFQAGDKLYKLADILSSDKFATYRKLVSHWENTEQLVVNSHEPETRLSSDPFIGEIHSYLEQMQYLDTITYLPDDILTKVDRASMAVALEARVPLLDHRVVEHAWSLPVSMKLRDGKSKWALRQILYKYVPSELVERPKMGFGVPIDSWLRGPLREWAESLLDKNMLEAQGYLNTQLVREKWEEHQSGKKNWQYHLWDILMFQAWFDRWMN